MRARAPGLPIAFVGEVPEELARAALGPPLAFRRAACDVGLRQLDALRIDEPGSAAACAAFDAGWEARVAEEETWLRSSGARLAVCDVPALPFEAAARAGVPAVGLANFSWDWIYRHLAVRQPALLASAERAARAYRQAPLLLSLPFAGDLSAFPRREEVGLVVRRPRTPRAEGRRRLGLDGRPAALLSFGGIGLPSLRREALGGEGEISWLLPEELPPARLAALGLTYPDVVGAVDAVVTKPGYGIAADCIGAGTRMLYTGRGDFPEYPVMVRELPRWLAVRHLPGEELLSGRLAEPVRRLLEQPVPVPPGPLDGAQRAAERLLGILG
ncbi:MAG: hypothetical protein HZB56_12710 [Deltaproteobacteria bacterium]|nr:hypothetical protein [Deltaproteobacteria bacterium]